MKLGNGRTNEKLYYTKKVVKKKTYLKWTYGQSGKDYTDEQIDLNYSTAPQLRKLWEKLC